MPKAFLLYWEVVPVWIDDEVYDELYDYFNLWEGGGRLAVNRSELDHLFEEDINPSGDEVAPLSERARETLAKLRDWIRRRFEERQDLEVVEIQF